MPEPLIAQVVEIWFLYLIGAVMIAARIYCRTKLVGYKHYKLDDYLIFAVAALWTAAAVMSQVFVQIAKGLHTSDLSFEERKSTSPMIYYKWEYGSKMFMLGLTSYFLIIWLLKFNMLCFYQRVVRGLWVEIFVKPVMGLVLASAVAIILTLALTCRPFHKLWQVWPDPGDHCVPQNIVFFVVILTFNLLTDAIVAINTDRLRKIGLLVLFSLGFFCMFAAVLRFALIFHLNQRGVSALWSLREECVGIVVGQAPLVTPMLKRQFWVAIGYATPKSGEQDPNTHPSRGQELVSCARAGSSRKTLQSTGRKASDPYSLMYLGDTKFSTESDEDIMRESAMAKQPQEAPVGRTAGIMVEHTIEIESTTGRLDNTEQAQARLWYSIA